MEIRLIDTICISTYEDKSRGDVKMLKVPDGALQVQGKGWLVVDDLVDTGETLKAARALLPDAYFTTVYGKPDGLPLVDTYVHRVEQDCWVVFPWDVPADDN